jgi:pimeloyl-ACP methyl ester carboxylesterase
MIPQIKNKTQHVVSMHELMFRPTIKQLADFLSNSENNTYAPMVSLNSYHGEAKPLFCIHPAGGSIYPYYSLALKLSQQRPVIGIMNRSYIEPDWFDDSWHSIVNNYVNYIRNQQPKGPYLLLGWSLGGLLAIDIADVLEQQGEKVNFLGLLDPDPSGDAKSDIEKPAIAFKSTSTIATDGNCTAEKMAKSTISLDPGTNQYLRLIADVFPSISIESITKQYLIFEQAGFNNEKIRQSMTIWIAEKEGVSLLEVENIRDNLAFEQELGNVDMIHDHLSKLSQSFTFKANSVVPHYWWANLSQHKGEIEKLENFICQNSNGANFKRIDAWHEDFLYCDELLESIEDKLSDK